jgi:rhodanese-related sulfurtransferase
MGVTVRRGAVIRPGGIMCATALCCAIAAMPVAAQEGPVAEAVIDYMDFAEATAGIILPQQLTRDIFDKVHFVDTRSRQDFDAGTIPGAVHIEWREVPRRLNEIPDAGMVVLFCNTGVRSSQATFAARLMGRENVLVMQGGYEGWLSEAAWRPE